jgi:exosortase C (VPDSG-CTERM-specific)
MELKQVATQVPEGGSGKMLLMRLLKTPGNKRGRLSALAAYILLLALCFVPALARLMWHSAQNELHSHIPLVPVIAGYLLYIRRPPSSIRCSTSARGAAGLAAMSLVALALASWWSETLSVNDHLALTAFAFVGFLSAGGLLFLGTEWMASAAFPFAFLLFIVPLPDVIARGFETLSMRASATVAAWFFELAGTPFVRDGQTITLPGIVLEVAKECSGIRSSWVLFITGLLASHLFLRSPWRRIVLVAFVIPLGIVRNGFRILVIGLLCVHLGPQMIHSPIHNQGGPLFFALSLGPFFSFLWWLRRRER